MAHPEGLSEWTQQVSSNLPHLSKPQAHGLAWWSYGIVMMRTCGRTTIATFLALLLGKKAPTVAQRLRDQGDDCWRCVRRNDHRGPPRLQTLADMRPSDA